MPGHDLLAIEVPGPNTMKPRDVDCSFVWPTFLHKNVLRWQENRAATEHREKHHHPDLSYEIYLHVLFFHVSVANVFIDSAREKWSKKNPAVLYLLLLFTSSQLEPMCVWIILKTKLLREGLKVDITLENMSSLGCSRLVRTQSQSSTVTEAKTEAHWLRSLALEHLRQTDTSSR